MENGNITEHGRRAAELFLSGYNCAQSVFMAFDDVHGFDVSSAARLMSAFGGGMCASRGVCGAVVGMLAVLGTVNGYSDADDSEGKRRLYRDGQELMDKFRDTCGSTVCRELLAGIPLKNTPSERSAEYYRTRPCAAFCAEAAMLLDGYLGRGSDEE